MEPRSVRGTGLSCQCNALLCRGVLIERVAAVHTWPLLRATVNRILDPSSGNRLLYATLGDMIQNKDSATLEGCYIKGISIYAGEADGVMQVQSQT